jgi:hypothetical protein
LYGLLVKTNRRGGEGKVFIHHFLLSIMVKCKKCGKRRARISKRGLCMDCVILAVDDSAVQLKKKEGPIYEKWEEKTRAYRTAMKKRKGLTKAKRK